MTPVPYTSEHLITVQFQVPETTVGVGSNLTLQAKVFSIPPEFVTYMETTKTTVAASATEAANWAITPENTLVPEGNQVSDYSALHHAKKAQGAQTAAETARDQAQALFDQFGDQFLGAMATPPTLDNNGTALEVGDSYYDTTLLTMRWYNGVSWESPQNIATTAATDANNSAIAAAASESNAATSEANAATSETNAGASATAAQNWAITAEDVLVPEGNQVSDYSALHHAAKAAASAGAAATSETNAGNSATAAAASEGNAATSETNAAASEANAATSETNAGASATEASNWAITPEDTLVPEGNLIDQYSALHHANKAAASAAAAATEVSNHVAATDPHTQYMRTDATDTVNGIITFTSTVTHNSNIRFDGDDHQINPGDGGGAFNLRVGHQYSTGDKHTHDGQGAIHMLFDHEVTNPGLSIKISGDPTGTIAGDAVTWAKEFLMRSDGTLTWDGNTVWHAGNLTPANYLQTSGTNNLSSSAVYKYTSNPAFPNSGVAGGGGLFPGNGDNANATTANVKIGSWYGVGFSPSIAGQTVPQGENAVYINVRTGDLGARGTINAAAFNTTSARSKKTNIKPFEQSGLDLIDTIDVVSFHFKADPTKDYRVGFIADDTSTVFSGRDQDKMDLANTVGVLIKAVQELRAENAELKGLIHGKQLQKERH